MNDAFVHDTAIVDAGAVIGRGTKVWHFTHIQTGAVIGENCSLGQNVYVGENVHIGSGCRIQNNVSLYRGVELEDDVFCGPSCVFTNDLTPRAKYPKGSSHSVPTLVRRGASIGANATVVCGHTVGKWALIAAGAVVAENVKDHALMMGVPAKQRGWVCECGQVLPSSLVCPDCSRAYREKETGLEETGCSSEI